MKSSYKLNLYALLLLTALGSCEHYKITSAENQKAQQAISYCESNESIIRSNDQKIWGNNTTNQIHETLKESDKIFGQYKAVAGNINRELIDIDTVIRLDDCDEIFKAGEYASNFLKKERDITNFTLGEIKEQNAEIRSYLVELVGANLIDLRHENMKEDEIRDYTLKQYKYCMYNYPLVGDISKYVYAHDLPSNKYNCKGFAKILSKNVTLDEKPRKILSGVKTDLHNKMKEIQDQKDRLYDYEERLDRLKGKMRDVESDEEILKYLKQIHKDKYLNIYCQHSSPQTPACEICGVIGNSAACKASY